LRRAHKNAVQEKNVNHTLLVVGMLVIAAIIGWSISRSKPDMSQAIKNTLMSQLHDLDLGIAQVQGYVQKMQEDTPEARGLKALADRHLQDCILHRAAASQALDRDLQKATANLDDARASLRLARRLSELSDYEPDKHDRDQQDRD